jgi:hypothetical protein
LDKNVRTLVVGNSHPQCAINDSLFGNCKNFARAGEPFIYLQFKLEKLLVDNPQVDRVILEISDHEFKHQLRNWIYKPMVVESAVKAYWAFWPIDFHQQMFSVIGLKYFSYLLLGQQKYLISLMQLEEEFFDQLSWGGFKNSKVHFDAKKKEESQVIKSVKCDSLFQPVSENFFAFKRIQEICDKYNKEIVFIRCPIHISKPNCFQSDYKRLIGESLEIKVLDFRDFPLLDEDFADEEHLNGQGAFKFTSMLKDTLSKIME